MGGEMYSQITNELPDFPLFVSVPQGGPEQQNFREQALWNQEPGKTLVKVIF